ncbi:hypothetical protein SODG_000062 [Sodalis praecaptivus]
MFYGICRELSKFCYQSLLLRFRHICNTDNIFKSNKGFIVQPDSLNIKYGTKPTIISQKVNPFRGDPEFVEGEKGSFLEMSID